MTAPVTVGMMSFAGGLVAEAMSRPASSGNAWDWMIFGIVYLGVAIGTIPFTRLSRAAIALLGAIAVVALNRMTFAEATAHPVMDWTTLALLFALMLVAASLRVSGFYTWIIQLIIDHAHRPWALLSGVIFSSAVLSALFANDIICLAFAPVLCVGLQRAGRQPLPYLLALATSSNIGSAATIIGNPQNMLIGQSAKLSFGHYTLVVAPLVVLCLVVNILVIAWIYTREIFGTPEVVMEEGRGPDLAVRPWHIAKTLIITAVLVGVFLFTQVPREIAALTAAGLVLISRTQDPRKLFALVDWDLILLFIGLFIVIGNVQQHGLLTGVMGDLESSGVRLYAPVPFAAITLVLSNLVSNVPAVLLLQPGLAIPVSPADPVTHIWYLLAVVSTFAGNLTLLGSIANLIVAEQVRPHGVEMRFGDYLKVGLPLTLVTTAAAVVYFQWVV